MPSDLKQEEQEGARPRPWRFQISLKTLMVVATFLCLLLGYFVALHRSGEEMRARSWATRNLIMERVAVLPRNATMGAPRKHQGQSQRLRPQTQGPRSSHRTGILGHSTQSAAVFERHLQLSPAADDSPVDVAKELLEHYEMGLSEFGLQRVSFGWRPRDRDVSPVHGATAFSIWQSFDHGMSIVIEVDVDVDPAPAFDAGRSPAPVDVRIIRSADRTHADVRIIFTHNEQKWIW